MPVPFEFDFLKPDYTKVFHYRAQMLQKLNDPIILAGAKQFYKENPAQFINDWGCTFDPRNADIGLPSLIPFVLFPRQEEWCDWLVQHWRDRRPGLTPKSRDMGMTWLSVGMACAICLFNQGIVIGFGSRKQDYVDKIGDPKTLFWKMRKFLEYVPAPFLGDFNLRRDAPFMRIVFPGTNSVITGESGDGIGRGDRTSIYFVDEAAFIERPHLTEASLSNTTNCRIDVSSANGMTNPFAQKVTDGKIDTFTFHWRDDPRKNDNYKGYELIKGSGQFVTWYEKMQNDLDAVTLAQEVDINFNASVEGIVIPNEWIIASIGAAAKLGLHVTGATLGALDIADEGKDLNAFCARKGIEIISLTSWSGKGSDTFNTTEKTFLLCDEYACFGFSYDSDGMGTSVRGDSRVINERRLAAKNRKIEATPFRGSGAVLWPTKPVVKTDPTGRKNEDFFLNRKAQSWWFLRQKFQNTFRAVNGFPYDPEEIISIPTNLPNLSKLQLELVQPTYSIQPSGKIMIDKAPANTRSPNLADSVMMCFAPVLKHNGLFS